MSGVIEMSLTGGLGPGLRLSLLKLRLAMIGTWALVTALATLLFVGVLTLLGIPFIGLYGIIGFVVFFHLIQWLLGPSIVNAVYRVKPADESEFRWLHEAVRRLSEKSGLKKTPKLMVADIDIPNAFAYGSPSSGPMVAVTRGLLRSLPKDEVEAVIGHELGHLKHRDIVVMMAISIIPAVIYYLGYTLYISGWFGGYGYRDARSNVGLLLLVGIALIVASFIFNLFVFYMSRLREYYADAHAAMVVKDGARRLQRALVRIMQSSGRFRRQDLSHYSQFKAFFIADPEKPLRVVGDVDAIVEELKRQRPGILSELFSTHPHPAKRLRNLDNFINVGE